jgi:GTP1/Obg family GTP-binding protein
VPRVYRFLEGLKSVHDGGAFAPVSIAAYQQQIGALDAHVARVQEVATQAVEHVRQAKTKESNAALERVLVQLPPHKEDLAVIEAISKCMSDARRCAT